MKTLTLLIIAIVFLAGCINQTQNNNPDNTVPPSTTPSTNPSSTPSTTPENVTQPENIPNVSVPKTYDVAIRNFVFSLTITTINVGDSVRWTNYDVNDHTATADDGSFDTGTLNKGESKTIVFDTIGTYAYHCTFHPWMTGKIVVE